MEVLKLRAFEPGSFAERGGSVLQEIKRKNFNFVLLIAWDRDMKEIASSAATQGMTNAGWAWLMMEGLVAKATEEMHGWLYMRQFIPSEGMHEFANQVSKRAEDINPEAVNKVFSLMLYNAITLYAHAATKVLREGGALSNAEAVTSAVRNTSFESVGGFVVDLDSNGDPVESYEVMNYATDGTGVAVGLYNSARKQYTVYAQEVIWPPGDTTIVPDDYLIGTPFK